MRSAYWPRPGVHPASGCLNDSMRLLLNIIWLVLSGFWLFLGYVAAGIICCILIITIPFGIASFRIALYALWPFGRTVVATPDLRRLSPSSAT